MLSQRVCFLKKKYFNKNFNLICRNYYPRRAMLYVPGNDMKKLQKAFTINVDSIIFDCEDGVALNKKNDARQSIKRIIDQGKDIMAPANKSTEWSVRINSVDSGLCEDDLNCIFSGKNVPESVLLPKVESIEHLEWFSDKLNSIISKDNEKINLLMYIESAKGILNLESICKKAMQPTHLFKPVGLVFGSDDFCASIGITRSEDSNEIIYARQKMLLVAKVFGLQAIDMVYIQFKDLNGLKKQCLQGTKMGYTGKQIIHPCQVDIVQETFMPTNEKINWAQNLLQSYEQHQSIGKGAFVYEGNMIDKPTMEQAKNILKLIESIKS